MNNYIFSYKGFTFKRVSKKKAFQAFKTGLTVWISPCNLRPFSMWNQAFDINLSRYEEYGTAEPEELFNKICMYFEIYNCINTETGKYIAYYIPVCKVDMDGTKIPNNDYSYKYDDKYTSYDYSILNMEV